jgi:hypothetical protein
MTRISEELPLKISEFTPTLTMEAKTLFETFTLSGRQ